MSRRPKRRRSAAIVGDHLRSPRDRSACDADGVAARAPRSPRPPARPPIAVDVDDGDRRAFAGQGPRRGPADAPAAAGHDGDLVLKSSHGEIIALQEIAEEFGEPA